MTKHGSHELDEDAAKLEAMGADPGPTIAELEAMLAQGPDRLRVQINPDGSVRVIELPVIHDLNIIDDSAETHE